MNWLWLFIAAQVNVYFTADRPLEHLKERIDAAQSSIDFCFYNIDSSLITQALVSARRERNVRVRVITDNSRLGRSWVNYLRSNRIPVWTDSIDPGTDDLMHNKFAVFDYGDGNPANDWVWTGSLNVSAGSLHADNVIEIQDSGLAHAYTAEFEQMWGGADSLPNPGRAEFHTGKRDRLNRHRFTVGGDTFLVYFAPQDRPVDTLTRLVAGAEDEVGFAIYSFTHLGLAQSMRERARQGVWVGGTFDRSESTNTASCFDSLRRWGIPVYTDKYLGVSNMLHEKIMVIDRRIAVTGSVNWSLSGNYYNDENSLICRSAPIAERYRAEIQARYEEAGGRYHPQAVVETPAATGAVAGISPGSNPRAQQRLLHFTLSRPATVSLNLYSAGGQKRATLAAGSFPAGSHQCLLPEGLSSGVYLLQLNCQAGGNTVGKLVIP